MKELEPIYICIAECGACVNNEDGNFDELMEQVLSEVLQIEELLDKKEAIPTITLNERVLCQEMFGVKISSIFLTKEHEIEIFADADEDGIEGAGVTEPAWRFPRQTMQKVMLQIEKQLKCAERKYWWGVYKRFFKEEFMAWRKLTEKDLLYSLQMTLMATQKITAHPFKLGKPVNHVVLQEFCNNWQSTINNIINEVNEGASYDDIRVCDNCGLPMSDGYYLGGEYACDDECCLALYNGDKAQMEEDLSHVNEDYSDCYYTEWESIFFD